jgi:hypothetical protein
MTQLLRQARDLRRVAFMRNPDSIRLCHVPNYK